MITAAPSTVSYLGPEGTFSHLVALRRFPKNPGLPCATITEVVHAVCSGAASFGIVPIENSSGGTITETVDLLIEQAGEIFIREELALDVRLALIGKMGADFNKIKAIYSHVMPLRHHREWIAENLPAAQMIESSSTAEAARLAALSKDAVALAAPGAAPLYGLSILRFPVRPEAVNVTHFFVLAAASAAKAMPAKRIKLLSWQNFLRLQEASTDSFARLPVCPCRGESLPDCLSPCAGTAGNLCLLS